MEKNKDITIEVLETIYENDKVMSDSIKSLLYKVLDLQARVIALEGKKKMVGLSGGYVARHMPELLDHDCHNSPEDGCECNKYL